MQAIPQKVKNVSVYPFLDIEGHGPVVLPILINGEGTYGIGTLMTSIFYNLDLTGGDHPHGQAFTVHNQYYAVGEYEDGTPFQTPAMICTEAGKTPEFGRTVTAWTPLHSAHSEASVSSFTLPMYIDLGPLTDITVSFVASPPLQFVLKLIQNGAGNVIATRVGTPHVTGVEVTSGDRVGKFYVGMKGITITGKQKDGKSVTFTNLTCVSAGETAVFLPQLVG